MLSLWQNFHHKLHWKRPVPMLPVIISAKWQFRFSVDPSYWAILIFFFMSLWNLADVPAAQQDFKAVRKLSNHLASPNPSQDLTFLMPYVILIRVPAVCLLYEVSNRVVNYRISHINVPETRMSVYRQVSNISHTLVGNKIVDYSDVVGAAPVGATPTTSSFSI